MLAPEDRGRMFPVMLGLAGRRCLVVGGGGVALRKTLSLIDAGAEVTVVAPEIVPELDDLSRQGKVEIERRAYEAGEAASYNLVFAATDDRETNRQVFEDAERAGVWVNVADVPELCTFFLPARVQRSPLQLAIASGGESPFAVRRLRQLLERRFGPEWTEWVQAAARFREQIRHLGMSPDEQEVSFDRFFFETVDGERLTARVPTEHEMADWLAAPARAEIDPSMDRETPPATSSRPGRESPGPDPGLVSLVGAGPGGPTLLTVLAHQRLLEADAIVYDRLAAPTLPSELSSRVELHCVGKIPGRHPVPQEEINDLLVRLAGEGKRVVRLKGGDPFIFGRGGEEAETLAAEGIPFEVVPGITAGIGALSWLGIPVTFRGEAVRLTLVTAHECAKENGPQVRWDLLAKDPHATLVGYMGVKALPGVVDQLLAAGMDPATPAAMVERGTLAAQRSVVATIAELPSAVEREHLRPPAVFVIGPTVRHLDSLDWRRRLPLHGERLVVPKDATELSQALSASGAEVVPVPMPITPAARVVLGAAPLTGYVLLSPADVEMLDDERDGRGCQGKATAWCLGATVAARARRHGWRRIEEIEPAADWGELVARIGQSRWPEAGSEGSPGTAAKAG